MDPDQLLTTSDGSIDPSQLPDINSMIGSILGPVFWISMAITVLMVLFYMYSMARRHRVEKAILDIQKTLNEMNERDKALSKPQPATKPPSPSYQTETIAASQAETEDRDKATG